jgi:hypothetical protein
LSESQLVQRSGCNDDCLATARFRRRMSSDVCALRRSQLRPHQISPTVSRTEDRSDSGVEPGQAVDCRRPSLRSDALSDRASGSKARMIGSTHFTICRRFQLPALGCMRTAQRESTAGARGQLGPRRKGPRLWSVCFDRRRLTIGVAGASVSELPCLLKEVAGGA